MSDFEKSHALEQAVLSAYVGSSATLALYTTLPDENGAGGVELSGAGYSRQAVSFGSPTTISPTESSEASTADVTFGPATADWADINGFVLYLSGGSGYFYYAPTASIKVLNTQKLIFSAGRVVVFEG